MYASVVAEAGVKFERGAYRLDVHVEAEPPYGTRVSRRNQDD